MDIQTQALDYADKFPQVRIVQADREDATICVQDGSMRRMSLIPNIVEVTDGAQEGSEKERQMSILQGVRLYPKAIMWSMLLSTALVMEGYDVVLLATFYAFPTFQRKYGVLQPNGTYQLSPAWQAGLSNGANVGEILGLFVNGIVSERYGYRKTMIVSLVLVIFFVFIPFFAKNVETLLIGEILCGIPWGVFQTLTTAYAAEVTPVSLRAYLTTYVNLCWILGQLIASGVLRSQLNRADQWAYRIPFALQWMWPIPLILGIAFAPESPWWLIRKGRNEDAAHALRRLTSNQNSLFDPKNTIAMMIHTNELEKEISSGTSYWDCFKGVDLRRTEIVCAVWAIQSLCGSAFMGFSTYFYEQAGLPTTEAFDLSMAQYGLGAVGTIIAWFAIGHFGRRQLYLAGLALLDLLLLVVGLVGLSSSMNTEAQWAIGSMLLIYTFICRPSSLLLSNLELKYREIDDITVGPVCYSLVAEISSTRLRTKSIVLSRNLYNIIGIINNIWTPYMLNPS